MRENNENLLAVAWWVILNDLLSNCNFPEGKTFEKKCPLVNALCLRAFCNSDLI